MDVLSGFQNSSDHDCSQDCRRRNSTPFCPHAKHRRFTASSVVLHQGDPAERLFLLTSGQGRHFVTTNEGRKIPLHWLTAGQIFGGAALLANSILYLASTELISDSCALVWDRQTIRALISRCPELLDNALSISVTEHIAWMVASQVSLTSDDARGRIAHYLLSLACGIGVVSHDGIELKINNEDLAAGANVTPFTASRVLSQWQRAGVLTKRRGKLVLRKPRTLVGLPRSPRSLLTVVHHKWPVDRCYRSSAAGSLRNFRTRSLKYFSPDITVLTAGNSSRPSRFATKPRAPTSKAAATNSAEMCSVKNMI